MSADARIMTDCELTLLQARRVANPDLYVDPVVVDRLMATAIHYRNAIMLAEKFLPSFVREQVQI